MQDVAAAVALEIENADNDHFQRSCGRKIKYSTEREARRDAKAMHKKRHKRLHVYPCTYCGDFHIGSVRSKEAGRRRALSRGVPIGDIPERVTILPREPYNTGVMLTALCIWREARGCSYRAKRAIFCVLRNRCRMAPAQGFRSTMDQNILKPYAFSSFNSDDLNCDKYPEPMANIGQVMYDAVFMDCMHAAESGDPNDDITGGAVFYYSDPITHPPKAWGPVVITAIIDGLTFCAIDRNPVS